MEWNTGIKFLSHYTEGVPYKQNIWQTLYLANEGKNRFNWRSTL